MAKEEILIGLEIGTSKICAAVGELKNDGSVKILGVGEAPSRGVRKGEIIDFNTAQTCVREALVDAEAKSDVMIESVYVSISGAHIDSFNNRGSLNIPDDQEAIEDADCDQVRANATEMGLSNQHSILHSLIQHYYVDGQEGVMNPNGMLGRLLEADCHVIHGITTRIQNTVRCIKELGLDVAGTVFGGLASAQVVLGRHEKDIGAVVIDIGGGTTEYIAYVEGVPKHSGVLAVGGDHITNDICMGLRMPISRAEKLKVEEGSVSLGTALPGEMIVLKDDAGFAGKEVEREMLNTIIHERVRELFELLNKSFQEKGFLNYAGAGIYLTGGTSALGGITHLAEEIFQVPVHLYGANPALGSTAPIEDPRYSTAIGLVRYAQEDLMDQPPSLFDIIKGKLPFFGKSR